ncbi:MAG: hypothetical protein MHPSP_000486, partial [Paramarteilia canceri]
DDSVLQSIFMLEKDYSTKANNRTKLLKAEAVRKIIGFFKIFKFKNDCLDSECLENSDENSYKSNNIQINPPQNDFLTKFEDKSEVFSTENGYKNNDLEIIRQLKMKLKQEKQNRANELSGMIKDKKDLEIRLKKKYEAGLKAITQDNNKVILNRFIYLKLMKEKEDFRNKYSNLVDELEKLENRCENKIKTNESIYRKEIQKLKDFHKSKTKTLVTQWNENRTKKIRDQVIKSFQPQLIQMKETNEKLLLQKDEEFKNKIADLKQNHENEIKVLEKNFTINLEKESLRLSEEKANNYILQKE